MFVFCCFFLGDPRLFWTAFKGSPTETDQIEASPRFVCVCVCVFRGTYCSHVGRSFLLVTAHGDFVRGLAWVWACAVAQQKKSSRSSKRSFPESLLPNPSKNPYKGSERPVCGEGFPPHKTWCCPLQSAQCSDDSNQGCHLSSTREPGNGSTNLTGF